MFCMKCGQQLPEGASFCSRCGTSVTTAAPPATSPVPAPVPVVDGPTSNTSAGQVGTESRQQTARTKAEDGYESIQGRSGSQTKIAVGVAIALLVAAGLTAVFLWKSRSSTSMPAMATPLDPALIGLSFEEVTSLRPRMERTAYSTVGDAKGYREVVTGQSWLRSATYVFGVDNRLKAVSASLVDPEAGKSAFKAFAAAFGKPSLLYSAQGDGVSWDLPSGSTLVLQNKGVCGIYDAGSFSAFSR